MHDLKDERTISIIAEWWIRKNTKVECSRREKMHCFNKMNRGKQFFNLYTLSLFLFTIQTQDAFKSVRETRFIIQLINDGLCGNVNMKSVALDHLIHNILLSFSMHATNNKWKPLYCEFFQPEFEPPTSFELFNSPEDNLEGCVSENCIRGAVELLSLPEYVLQPRIPSQSIPLDDIPDLELGVVAVEERQGHMGLTYWLNSFWCVIIKPIY